MKLFSGLEQIVKTDEPMSRHTNFGVGGPAQYFIEPGTREQLAEVLRRCRENQVPIYILGAGANVLVDDSGVRGAVIHLTGEQFTRVEFDKEGVKAGAAASLSRLVLRCVRQGRSGMECLAGIPGSIGGAIRMNAGGAFGDIGSIVESVDLMDTDGVTFTRLRGDLAFGYRCSNISRSAVILGATFRLLPDDPHRILKQIKQIWIYKKNTQPLASRSAGCIFKNPRGMSAGALIDEAGLKGKRVGGAYVSEKHGNFIITEPSARASDILKLINIIRETVYKRMEVYLELEIEVW